MLQNDIDQHAFKKVLKFLNAANLEYLIEHGAADLSSELAPYFKPKSLDYLIFSDQDVQKTLITYLKYLTDNFRIEDFPKTPKSQLASLSQEEEEDLVDSYTKKVHANSNLENEKEKMRIGGKLYTLYERAQKVSNQDLVINKRDKDALVKSHIVSCFVEGWVSEFLNIAHSQEDPNYLNENENRKKLYKFLINAFEENSNLASEFINNLRKLITIVSIDISNDIDPDLKTIMPYGSNALSKIFYFSDESILDHWMKIANSIKLKELYFSLFDQNAENYEDATCRFQEILKLDQNKINQFYEIFRKHPENSLELFDFLIENPKLSESLSAIYLGKQKDEIISNFFAVFCSENHKLFTTLNYLIQDPSKFKLLGVLLKDASYELIETLSDEDLNLFSKILEKINTEKELEQILDFYKKTTNLKRKALLDIIDSRENFDSFTSITKLLGKILDNASIKSKPDAQSTLLLSSEQKADPKDQDLIRFLRTLNASNLYFKLSNKAINLLKSQIEIFQDNEVFSKIIENRTLRDLYLENIVENQNLANFNEIFNSFNSLVKSLNLKENYYSQLIEFFKEVASLKEINSQHTRNGITKEVATSRERIPKRIFDEICILTNINIALAKLAHLEVPIKIYSQEEVQRVKDKAKNNKKPILYIICTNFCSHDLSNQARKVLPRSQTLKHSRVSNGDIHIFIEKLVANRITNRPDNPTIA